jgi:hypothetical protein
MLPDKDATAVAPAELAARVAKAAGATSRIAPESRHISCKPPGYATTGAFMLPGAIIANSNAFLGVARQEQTT